MFDEAWRLERDFYYDPAMGGLDWKAVGERYRQLVPYVAHRADLNYILGELIGELSTSHAYVGGGDMPAGAAGGRRPAGRRLRAGRRRAACTASRRSTARATGTRDSRAARRARASRVREGDFLLAVNGRPVRAPENVYAAFIGTVGKQTTHHGGRVAQRPEGRAPTR